MAWYNLGLAELSYISGKEYSEPWHNATFVHFWKWGFLALISPINVPCDVFLNLQQ